MKLSDLMIIKAKEDIDLLMFELGKKGEPIKILLNYICSLENNQKKLQEEILKLQEEISKLQEELNAFGPRIPTTLISLDDEEVIELTWLHSLGFNYIAKNDENIIEVYSQNPETSKDYVSKTTRLGKYSFIQSNSSPLNISSLLKKYKLTIELKENKDK